jgi:predicted small secreted protein
MKSSIKFALAALFTLAAFATTGCNTVKGFGQDLERAGEAIQNSGD